MQSAANPRDESIIPINNSIKFVFKISVQNSQSFVQIIMNQQKKLMKKYFVTKRFLLKI